MLRELSAEELRSLRTLNTELNEASIELADELESGGKVKVKEKITSNYHSFVVYRYDKNLYRYIVVGQYFI